MNLINGHGFSYNEAAPYVPSNFRVPGFPLMLSIVYRVAGVRPWVMLLLHIVFSLATLVLISVTCGIVFGPRSARVCGFLLALCPLDIVGTQVLLREPLFALLNAGFWSAWILYVLRGRWWQLATAGIALALATYVRENTMLLPVVLLMLLGLQALLTRTYRRGLVMAMVLTVSSALPLLPWSLRNHVRLKTWSLSSAGGMTMLNGNGALLLVAKHNADYVQMMHILWQVRRHTLT
ncbi:MAG: hypothetical protein BWZ07_03277 [Alphaproteobacteria bacterium ADurb.BinA280]|nr:MAG: hypothetical protein BWZ07_03277 [Alphaproteobacteria bacterium ADurb.BinA280]